MMNKNIEKLMRVEFKEESAIVRNIRYALSRRPARALYSDRMIVMAR